MKKVYFTPEEEIIVLNDDVFITDDSCNTCDYLVCEGEDAIIPKKVKQPSDSKTSSEGPKNKVGFDMTFDR